MGGGRARASSQAGAIGRDLGRHWRPPCVLPLPTPTLSPLLHLALLPAPAPQIGNLQGAAQLLAKLSGSVSGTLADLVSPARMVILGAALTALNKPMYAASGAVAALAGTTACLYWVAGAKVRLRGVRTRSW